VGDVRISFEVVEPTAVSLIAEQSGSSFKPFETSNGRTIHMLSAGSHTPEAMFETAQEGNRALTWTLRIVGISMMFLGLMTVLRPLAVVASFLPFLETLAGFGLGLVAILVALPFSLLTIAIAWLFYRPLLAIVLIAVGAALLVAAMQVGKRFGDKEAAASPQAQTQSA
jgi:hypothetical protein